MQLRAAGLLTATEITEALDVLADSLVEDGKVDWIAYAERRGFKVLPAQIQTVYSPHEFLRYFPKACEEAVMTKFGSGAATVLMRRMFRHPDILVPLSALGRHLSLTPERARLLENSILKMLRRAIWHEEYRGCRFRFRPEFLEPLRQLADRIQGLPEGNLSAEQWVRILQESWNIEATELGQQEILLLQLLGLDEELPQEVLSRLPGSSTPDAIRKATSYLQSFFGLQRVKGSSLGEVRRHLIARMGENAPDEPDIQSILHSLPAVEQVKPTGEYRVRLHRLQNNVQRCERILRDRGATMHFRELHAEISRLCPEALRGLSPEKLGQRVASSPRFSPVGKSGQWGLRVWPHVRTGSVADMAAQVMQRFPHPLTEQRLYELITPLREVKRTSIGSLLNNDRRFRRVAPSTWSFVEQERSS